MPLRHLVVTPLPNGRSAQTANLSVHLSPRLRRDGVLSDYPDVRDWGQFVTAAPALQFQVLVNGVPRPPAAVTVVSPAVNRDVWRAVFGRPAAAVPVKAFAFLDRTNSRLARIDSATLSARAVTLAKTIAGLGAGVATRAQVEQASAELRSLLPAARDFYAKVGDGADPVEPTTEFHDQLGLLGAHPYLLRVLGLVYDLQVTLPVGLVPNEVSVRTNWATKAGDVAARDEVPMRMRVDRDFVALVEQTAYRDGAWLRLSAPVYALAQLDQVNATTQLGHLDAELAAKAPDAAVEVPALLESGLSVVHTDLAPLLAARFDRQRTLEDGIDAYIRGQVNRTPQLWAEDVTTGVRYDVEDASRPGFRSLHDRRAPSGYLFPRDASLVVAPPQDEGWSSIALFTDGGFVHTPASTTVQYQYEGAPNVDKVEERDNTAWRVDDHIVTWGGWSLSTPGLGTTATAGGGVKPRERNVPIPDSPTKVIVDYTHVNGTLPKLRYGRSYRFRGRAVDLGGNGADTADTAPITGVSPTIRFGRLAPLSPPQLVRRSSRPDPGVGDLPNVLVIRSELTDANTQIASTDRLLFPPRISQGRLERHDLPNGGNDPAPSTYKLIADRDARSLSTQTLEDPETGELVAGLAVVGGQVTQGPERPAVLYLADAATNQVAFHGLPHASPTTPVLVRYGTWPSYEAVRLELAAGIFAPRVSAAQKRVTVSLPKGTIATAELSSAPDQTLLGHLLLAQDPANAPGAADGTNRAISPRRPVTFVHAVRVPLAAPSFSAMTAARTAAGQTDVVIAGTALLHRATTERLVLRGEWTDTVDDPAKDGPVDQLTRRVVDRWPVDLAGNDATTEPIAPVSIDFGDTRRRYVTVTSEAYCRFSRYFTERREVAAPAAGAVLLDARGIAVGTAVVTNLATRVTFERGRQYTVNGTTGELTVVDATAIPAGTLLRAEFVPLPISRRSADATTAQTFEFDVPASAAPPVPHVIAALPAFARTVSTTDTKVTVVHDGRVVRLHLARPWFESGRLERLGVAVDLAGVASPALTRWARDPLTDSAGPFGAVTTASFPKATVIVDDVDGRFRMAAHDVVFDATRRLWMADVLVDATFGYRPFVFLHVCRHQDLAIDGLHASPTVEVTPVRLGARREVIVTSLAGRTVDVALTGPDATNVVTVVEQEADPSVADPDVRWRDVATPPTTLTRTGTTAAATHAGQVQLASVATERRLVIQDAEQRVVGGVPTGVLTIAYREVIALPAGW
jgi:hypothetical protein